jgi:hypothetical protein
MQSLGCHTIKAEIQPNDAIENGSQRAQLGNWDGNLTSFGNQPSLRIQEGQTAWYGYAFQTNSGYVPHYDSVFGNANAVMSFHDSSGGGRLAPLMLEVQTLTPAYGSNPWFGATTLTRAAQPHLGIQINGGNQNDSNWPNEGDGQFTCRRYQGPVFTAGHLYRVQWKVTWGAHMNGSVELWIDGTRYVDVSGVSNMWYSGTTVDTGMYVLFQNYRTYDNTLPDSIFYYGGLIRGSTQADVTVP